MSHHPQVHQPIHPDVRPLLDPEYVAFHDAHVQYLLPDEQRPWDASARAKVSSLPVVESTSVAVGSTRDIDRGLYKVRVFTPDVVKPHSGWPVFIWLHGGGWVVGDVSSGNDLCTLICQRAQCVVVTVAYRLAPEHPYPTAFEDAVDTLRWVHSDMGARELETDRERIALGGTSSGGQLAASLSMEAASMQPPIQIAFQLLVLPIIDSTATTSTTWATNKNSPWLTPARMMWFRRMYLPDEATARDWKASPNFAPRSLLAKSPRTWIAVAEQDLLAPEGNRFTQQLSEAWEEAGIVDAGVVVVRYQGSAHSILSLNGVLSRGKQLLHDTANQAARWFSMSPGR